MLPELLTIFTQFVKKEILDWSKREVVSIALGQKVFSFNQKNELNETQSVPVQIFSSKESFPTSIKSSSFGNKLMIGTDDGYLTIVDLEKQLEISNLKTHSSRISCLSFRDENIFSSGSRDKSIINYDIRSKHPITSVFEKHTQDVCSLKWDSFATYLASGGNDNNLFVWDIRRNIPIKSFHEHKAAIRALCWSSQKSGILTSGGGNNDKSIKLWNVSISEEKSIETLKTTSQVCCIILSPHSDEMISTHGFSENQLIVWNLKKKQKICVINGHQKRILHAVLGPDGQSIATCASDGRLKFWKIFLKSKSEYKKHKLDFLDQGYFDFR